MLLNIVKFIFALQLFCGIDAAPTFPSTPFAPTSFGFPALGQSNVVNYSNNQSSSTVKNASSTNFQAGQYTGFPGSMPFSQQYFPSTATGGNIGTYGLFAGNNRNSFGAANQNSFGAANPNLISSFNPNSFGAAHNSQTALQTGQNSYSNGTTGGGFNFSAAAPNNGGNIAFNGGGLSSYQNGSSSFANLFKNAGSSFWRT